MVADALKLAVSQRLVKKVCPRCLSKNRFGPKLGCTNRQTYAAIRKSLSKKSPYADTAAIERIVEIEIMATIRRHLAAMNRSDKLCGFVREGLSIEVCCDLAGISRSVYYLWRNKGLEEEEANQHGRYAAFNRAIAAANAQAIRKLHGAVAVSNPLRILERTLARDVRLAEFTS